MPRALAVAALALFALLLIGLPIAAAVSSIPVLAVADAFYRAGARSSSAEGTWCCRCCTPR
jgi:chromate transporter